MLGRRKKEFYGDKTLPEIESLAAKRAMELGASTKSYQSNHEGSLIDFLQLEAPLADGIIINPGALTHYGLSLRDALEDAGLPIVEVHLSDIHSREEWRRVSVIEELAETQISGLGWQGYIEAVEFLIDRLKKRER